MQKLIKVLDGSNYYGYELVNTGYDNIFVQFEFPVNQTTKIKLGLLITKTTTREEAIAFLDNWTESTISPTFEIWWPLNNASSGFVANNCNISNPQSIEFLMSVIDILGLDCLYKKAA